MSVMREATKHLARAGSKDHFRLVGYHDSGVEDVDKLMPKHNKLRTAEGGAPCVADTDGDGE